MNFKLICLNVIDGIYTRCRQANLFFAQKKNKPAQRNVTFKGDVSNLLQCSILYTRSYVYFSLENPIFRSANDETPKFDS